MHLTAGSTYPILARLAHGPTRDKASNRPPPVSDAARRNQAERAERDVGCVRTLGKPLHALPAITAIVLIPWTVGIATQLPQLAVAHHWNTAWASLNVAIGLALTSWLAH